MNKIPICNIIWATRSLENYLKPGDTSVKMGFLCKRGILSPQEGCGGYQYRFRSTEGYHRWTEEELTNSARKDRDGILHYMRE